MRNSVRVVAGVPAGHPIVKATVCIVSGVLEVKGKADYSLPNMKSTISSKGQITVPAEIRDKLGLLPGTVVVFELHNGTVLLRKGGQAVHPVDRLYGTLKLSRSTDELLDEMRGPRPKRR